MARLLLRPLLLLLLRLLLLLLRPLLLRLLRLPRSNSGFRCTKTGRKPRFFMGAA